jgi:hypothetical protein
MARGPMKEIMERHLDRIRAGESRNMVTLAMAKSFRNEWAAIAQVWVDLVNQAIVPEGKKDRPFGFRQVDDCFRAAFKDRGLARFDKRPDARRANPNCVHPTNGLYAVIIDSGLKHVYTLCNTCLGEIPRPNEVGLKIRGPLLHDSLPAGTDIHKLEVVADLSGTLCDYCDSPEVELHHYAPWKLFPTDAFKYKTGYLCKPCHRRFHRTFKDWVAAAVAAALAKFTIQKQKAA